MIISRLQLQCTLHDEDVSGHLEDRLSKARRSLNTTSGLGIHSNGLTVATCNVILWSVVVTIALSDAELSLLLHKSIAL